MLKILKSRNFSLYKAINDPACIGAAFGAYVGSFSGMCVQGCSVGFIVGCISKDLSSKLLGDRDVSSQKMKRE